MKKLIILSAILILLTSCFIAIRVPSSAYTLRIENPTDSYITVTSSSFTMVRSVTIAANSSKEVEVSGVYDGEIDLKASGRYYTGETGMSVRINGDPVLRCSMVPDIGWVKLTNATGYHIRNISVAGSSALYDVNGKKYQDNSLLNGEYAYVPVFGSDCEKKRTIKYYRNGHWRSYSDVLMPEAGKTTSYSVLW